MTQEENDRSGMFGGFMTEAGTSPDGFSDGYRGSAVQPAPEQTAGDKEASDLTSENLLQIVEAQALDNQRLRAELQKQLIARIDEYAEQYQQFVTELIATQLEPELSSLLIQIASGHSEEYSRGEFMVQGQDYSDLLEGAESIGRKIADLIREINQYRDYTLDDTIVDMLISDMKSRVSPSA